MCTVQDVAKLFNKHNITIYRWLRDKKIKGIKIGHTWYVSDEEISRIMEEGLLETELEE